MKEERKTNVTNQNRHSLEQESLTPAEAGKLKGKLQYIGHFSVRHGRSFLWVFSERQYSKTRASDIGDGGPISITLKIWIMIVNCESDARRLVEEFSDEPAAVLIFTDGSHPENIPGRPTSTDPPRIGWVAFFNPLRRLHEEALFSSFVVTPDTVAKWCPSANQIAMVELLAAVTSIEALSIKLAGRKVSLFVDSEPIEGALVNG